LRGRAGRQGDPGSSRFYLALDDELMRRFAADRVAGLMERVGMEEDMPLESKLVSRFIESAQTRVEGYNFDIRKSVVDYDDVIAKQREVIYADRLAILAQGDMHDRIIRMIRDEVTRIVETSIPAPMVSEEEELETLFKTLEPWVHIPEEVLPENIHAIKREQLKADLASLTVKHYELRGEQLRTQMAEQGLPGMDPLRDLERSYLLQVLDRLWMDHIDSLDVMRAGIGLRALGQRDPLVEYKNEAYRMFDELKAAIQHYAVDTLLRQVRNEVTITLQRPEPTPRPTATPRPGLTPRPPATPRNVQTNADAIAAASGQVKSDIKEERPRSNQSLRKNVGQPRNGQTQPRSGQSQQRSGSRSSAPTVAATSVGTPSSSSNKVGRNDPCPCGSGKKYKKCHGA
jgi:preprotein translocase subunit SecA